jgi:hypothetical protein
VALADHIIVGLCFTVIKWQVSSLPMWNVCNTGVRRRRVMHRAMMGAFSAIGEIESAKSG